MRCRNVVDGASRPEDRGPADRVRVSQSTPRRNDAGLLEHTSIMNSLTPSACQDVQKQATDHVQKLWSEYERQAENLRRDANGTSEAAASTRFEVSFKATAGPYNPDNRTPVIRNLEKEYRSTWKKRTGKEIRTIGFGDRKVAIWGIWDSKMRGWGDCGMPGTHLWDPRM